MKKIFLSCLILFLLVHGQSLAQQPGTVRWSRTLNPGSSPSNDTLHSVRIQTDKKVVVAGNSGVSIALGRFDATGVLDASFGTNGVVITSLDSARVGANAMEIQPDGKIVVAGGYEKDSVRDFLVARYHPDGRPDSSFGTFGRVQTDLGSGSFDVATAIAMQPDGKIVVAGRANSRIALFRYHPDGSPDSTFGMNGSVVRITDGATCLKVQTNGKILVGGPDGITRLNPDGSPDAGFGTNAVTMLPGSCYDLAIQNDGKILIAGGWIEFSVTRLDSTGIPDNSFGNSGVTTITNFSPGASNPGQRAEWVCVQADGRILAGGWTKYCILGNCRDFALARYQSNGKLDSSFGINGKIAKHITAYSADMSYAAAINSNNELVVGGIYTDFPALPSGWVLVSYYLGSPLEVRNYTVDNGPVTIVPNPSSGIVTFAAPAAIKRIIITDLTGNKVYQVQPGSPQTTLNLGEKAAGVYFYEVECEAGIQRGKLVVY